MTLKKTFLILCALSTYGVTTKVSAQSPSEENILINRQNNKQGTNISQSLQNSQNPLEIELANLDIPEINASIKIPTSWSIWTILEAKAAVEKIEYPSKEAKAIALEGAQRNGADNLRVSRYIEPYNGINPTLTIAWSPIGNADIKKVPREARSEVCARTLKNTILPKLTEFSKSIEIVEQPTQIDNKGSGAWLTIKETVNLKNNPNKDLEVLTRIYLLLSENHFILVTATFSNKDDKDANTNKQVLGEIMKSFSFTSPQ